MHFSQLNGFKIDYRLGGKSYLIEAPTHNINLIFFWSIHNLIRARKCWFHGPSGWQTAPLLSVALGVFVIIHVKQRLHVCVMLNVSPFFFLITICQAKKFLFFFLLSIFVRQLDRGVPSELGRISDLSPIQFS